MVGGVVRVGTADELAWRQLRRTRVALAVTAGVLVVAALLPWARVSAPHGASFTVGSVDRGNGGWITFAVGAIVIGLWLTVFAAVAVVALSIAWMTTEYGVRRPSRRRGRLPA